MAEGNVLRLTAFVVGATGAVGSELVNALAANEAFTRVALIGRRKLELNGEKFKKFENNVVDFEKLEEYEDKFQGFDVGFCCLGTTRGKSGADGFVRVDHDYVVGAAKLAKKGGTKQFHLVSSTGANKNSMFLYPKTKGQVEEEISQMGFERTSIYRPGLLLCDRSERRMFEKFAQVVASSVDRWGKFSIPTVTVAQAMVKNALRKPEKSVEIVDHAQIFNLAKN